MAKRDDSQESRRTVARRERRTAGDRSAKLANELMRLSASALGKLELEEDLREAVDRARKITAQNARRRAERALAGDLRRFDLVDLHRKLVNVHATGNSEPDLMHAAERWRTRLIEEADTALADFPGGRDPQLPELIARARREKTTGKPPGASRALFRHVAALLKAQAAAPPEADDAEGDDAADADDDDDDADDDAAE